MGKQKKPLIKRQAGGHSKDYFRKKDGPKKPCLRERLSWLSPLPDALIILAYVFGVTFMPTYMGLDNNASKFLALSLINLLAFGLLLARKGYRNEPSLLTRFFRTGPGLAFAGFLFFSLLSFTQAINIEESILHVAKLFSVFAAAVILSAIMLRDMRYLKFIVIALVLLLLIDAAFILNSIRQVIAGEIDDMYDVRAWYGHKNILASALFVKIPCAIYLLGFQKGWMRALGAVALPVGVMAVFFIAARAFYVGLAVFTLAFVLFHLGRYIHKRRIKNLALAGSVIGVVLVTAVLFTYVQRHHFGDRDGRHFQGIRAQLSTIVGEEDDPRITFYRWTAEMIGKNPVLGVGSGNWKIKILKFENQENPGFVYSYKAHNDFLEAMAETGIPGGLLFLSIFFFTAWNFWRYHRKTDGESDPMYAALFLAASGLAFYSVDALFNFPADRPEIQVLFALFLATGVAASQKHRAVPKKETRLSSRTCRIVVVLALLLMAGSGWVLHQNFRSAQLQAITYRDIYSGSYQATVHAVVGQFPPIPSISSWVESVYTIQARYLLEAGHYRAAIDLLKDDRKNPYDSRRENFMARAYDHMGKADSALVYAKKAHELKPRYVGNVLLYAKTLMLTGALDKAVEVVETGQESIPWLSQRNRLALQEQLEQIEQIRPLNQAIALYGAGDYEAALNSLDEFIALVPDNVHAFNYRAYTNYHLGRHADSIEDINKSFELSKETPALLNMRGICFLETGEPEAACRDFRAAIEMGSETAVTNYERYCKERNQE